MSLVSAHDEGSAGRMAAGSGRRGGSRGGGRSGLETETPRGVSRGAHGHAIAQRAGQAHCSKRITIAEVSERFCAKRAFRNNGVCAWFARRVKASAFRLMLKPLQIALEG